MILKVAPNRNPDMRSALLASLFFAVPAVAADEVKLEPISLDGLLKAVADHKGKVVVVDVWGTF
jgi:hypothetical protein